MSSRNRGRTTHQQTGGTPAETLGIPDVYQPNEQTRQQYFPEIDKDDWAHIANAPGFESTTEERVFNSQYNAVAHQYYLDAVSTQGLEGEQVISLFSRWKPIVKNFVLASMRLDAVANKLGATLSHDPNGSGQAYMRPIRADSITAANASYAQTPAATDQFNIFPDETAGDDTFETPTSNEQAWIIFGMYEYSGSGTVPYDYIQTELDDATGVRQPYFVLPQLDGQGTLPIVEFHRGPLTAYPNTGIDIDVNVMTGRTGIETRLWPVGYEVLVESAAESGGILGL